MINFAIKLLFNFLNSQNTKMWRWECWQNRDTYQAVWVTPFYPTARLSIPNLENFLQSHEIVRGQPASCLIARNDMMVRRDFQILNFPDFYENFWTFLAVPFPFEINLEFYIGFDFFEPVLMVFYRFENLMKFKMADPRWRLLEMMTSFLRFITSSFHVMDLKGSFFETCYKFSKFDCILYSLNTLRMRSIDPIPE